MNLYDLLKDHIGKIFYSPIFGNMKLIMLLNDKFPIVMETQGSHYQYCFTKEGRFDNDGECVLFPSEDQRDWNKWIKKHKLKIPKTWSEVERCENVTTLSYISRYNKKSGDDEIPLIKDLSSSEKSALALMKIHQLIEISYGGNPTIKEKLVPFNSLVSIRINDIKEFKYYIEQSSFTDVIVFRSYKLAEEFMSHSENIQLLKDLYMI